MPTSSPSASTGTAWLDKYDSSLSGTTPGTHDVHLRVARDFLAYAAGKGIEKSVVTSYLDRLRRARYSDGTINKVYRILARFLKVNGFEILGRHDAPMIRETNVVAPALAPDVIHDMILARDKLPGRHAAFLAMGTTFGLRRSEILNLAPESFDWGQNLVFVESLKGSRQRYHYLPPEIRPYIADYDWSQTVTPYGANKVLWEVGEAIGMHLEGTEAGWHAIRRALDTLLLQNPGLPESAVRDFLRWRGAGMTARYYSARRFVGRDGVTTVMGSNELAQDEKIFTVHPFLPYWKEKEQHAKDGKGRRRSGNANASRVAADQDQGAGRAL